ncbi:DNA repair protein RecN [Pelobium manganitolerans]|uniref:DNA repair protein RecN n=1 Tax=Pelobium manganitolerans TaxID=1842495 RepID=A0A419S3D6_9SPHI|nr:DNA repair protein RecN [Pelobium manganitolerans]RKD13787.1 DNA repair protein RecN [Pelobium manganitolerans]
MLSRLTIKNYALIDNLDISFEGDLNVITGETGAGKSIVLGALGLILGQRAESKYFFNQQKKCVVEGFFSIADYNFKDFFSENDLDYEDETVLRREIALDGKSRAFINDTPVTLSVLKALGQQLIDIHAQHATLEISEIAFQLLVLDVMAEQQSAVANYRKTYQQYRRNQKAYQAKIDENEKAKADQDYFQYLYDELEGSLIQEEEQENLEKELNALSHAEEIKKNLYNVNAQLNGFEEAALSKIKDALTQLHSIEHYDEEIAALASRLRSCQIELKDIAEELDSLEQKTNYDENRADTINERLSIIYGLQKKHRVNTSAELLAMQRDLLEKLNQILFADEELEQLAAQLKKEEQQLAQEAKAISAKRAKVIPEIEQKVAALLAEVGMPDAKLKIEQQTLDSNGFDSNGADQIRFLFSANKGQSPNEIHKVASGGELSRLMLSIKSLIAQKTALPTIIFDEIDTGISGEVANRVGAILAELSKAMQVIAITHLPQMASKGKSHYFVHKVNEGETTYTRIKKLKDEERVLEIAKMLSGENPKESALQNARELLQN